MILLLLFCYISEVVDSRIAVLVALQFWALPLLVTLYTFTSQTSPWAYFAVVTLIAGFPYVHPVQVAWASTNSGGVGTRTVSASIYNMFVQAGGMIGVSTLHLVRTLPSSFTNCRDWIISPTYTEMKTRYA